MFTVFNLKMQWEFNFINDNTTTPPTICINFLNWVLNEPLGSIKESNVVGC